MKSSFLAGILGNLTEHYDSALYAMLAPILAPHFFPYDPLTSLILTFAIMPLGMLTRPLGALFFGYIGDTYGRRRALFLSLSGMAITTTLMGSLPTYQTVGFLAPVLLALGRIFQNFFASGETSGGAIFVLEESDRKGKNLLSSLYSCSTILGILIASFSVTVISYFGWIESGWRYLFFLGSIAGIFGLYMRRDAPIKMVDKEKVKPLRLLKKYPYEILSIILVSGFSYTIYAFCTSFMNGFLPLIASVSHTGAMGLNTTILLLDLAALPLFGILADRFSKDLVMGLSSLLAALFAPFLFLFLKDASLLGASFIRVFFVLIGACFAAPFHFWALSIVPKENRYLIISFSVAIGSQIIGAPSTAIGLMLYKNTGLTLAPAIYLSFTAIIASSAIYLTTKRVESRQTV